MSTILAPEYATLTMGYFEIKLYQEIENRLNITTKYEFMEKWKWFLYDCEIILNAHKIKSTSPLKFLNSTYPAIQFTTEVGESNLQFLDFMIHKDGNRIWMDIY